MSARVRSPAKGPSGVRIDGRRASARASGSSEPARRHCSTRSARRSGAAVSSSSSARCTTTPNRAPAGWSAIGDGRESGPSTGAPIDAEGLGLVVDAGGLRLVPDARAELVGRPPWAPAVSAEYDVRRHAVSTARSSCATVSDALGRASGAHRTWGRALPDDLEREVLGRARDQGAQHDLGRLVGGGGHARRGRPGGVARAEQQPGQRSAGRVRARRPPQDHLAGRPGQRDVGQPQRLADVVAAGGAQCVVVPRAALAADVQHARVVAVVLQRLRGGRAPAVPQVGHQDDRELQPLAGVHGDDLDGGRVGLQAPAALLGVVLRGLVDAPAQPLQQCGGPHALPGRDGVQRLADVAQVGEPALPVGPAQQPLAQAVGRGGLEQRRDAVVGQDAGPRRAAGR